MITIPVIMGNFKHGYWLQAPKHWDLIIIIIISIIITRGIIISAPAATATHDVIGSWWQEIVTQCSRGLRLFEGRAGQSGEDRWRNKGWTLMTTLELRLSNNNSKNINHFNKKKKLGLLFSTCCLTWIWHCCTAAAAGSSSAPVSEAVTDNCLFMLFLISILSFLKCAMCSCWVHRDFLHLAGIISSCGIT